jgi:hypothetical protein
VDNICNILGKVFVNISLTWQAIMSCKVALRFLNNFKWKEDSIMMFDITYQERDDRQHKLKKSCYYYWLT